MLTGHTWTWERVLQPEATDPGQFGPAGLARRKTMWVTTVKGPAAHELTAAAAGRLAVVVAAAALASWMRWPIEVNLRSV